MPYSMFWPTAAFARHCWGNGQMWTTPTSRCPKSQAGLRTCVSCFETLSLLPLNSGWRWWILVLTVAVSVFGLCCCVGSAQGGSGGWEWEPTGSSDCACVRAQYRSCHWPRPGAAGGYVFCIVFFPLFCHLWRSFNVCVECSGRVGTHLLIFSWVWSQVAGRVWKWDDTVLHCWKNAWASG
jgi:hypothetical protein